MFTDVKRGTNKNGPNLAVRAVFTSRFLVSEILSNPHARGRGRRRRVFLSWGVR